VPISSGCTATEAIRNTIDLARRAEALGYRRYWLAEHHLNPGVAGSSPAVVAALLAGATSRIRLGSGAVQIGHRTPLSVVEEFGLLAAACPGRIDLGLGRSGGPPPGAAANGAAAAPQLPVAAHPGSAPGVAAPGPAAPDGQPGIPRHGTAGAGGPASRPPATRTPEGLLLPPPFSFARVLGSPRFAAQAELLHQPGAAPPSYTQQVEDVLALLAGRWRSTQDVPVQAVPGEHADLEVWVLGSSAGESAEVAGARGLPFAANYHVSPATVVEAVTAYRAAFRPVGRLARPYVLVSADAVVAADDATARRLATGYAPWVRSIRTASGAIPFPTPAEADDMAWTDEERELVADRLDTQFVGSPATVAGQLDVLQAATGADELLVTTITHDHADRVRSYELLARYWAGTR
jgi:alkanesulfonate monooxygenase SsuD/methylene tetrahydromethanopterin reductase-like flavin-dependent oxidoreductase (luciferase family)